MSKMSRMADLPTFVRFVIAGPSENPYWATGIITAARILRDEGKLEPHEADRLQEVYDWLDEYLPCPPFKENRKRGKWSRNAVSWFKEDAWEAIGQMWEIVVILKEHGIPVSVVQTESPGGIVYSDDYQVVAETEWDAGRGGISAVFRRQKR